MRLASGPVLGLAAVVSSPALWRGLNGELALDIALTRYLVAVLVVWVALSMIAALVGDAPTAAEQPPAAQPGSPAASPAPLTSFSSSTALRPSATGDDASEPDAPV